MYDTLCTLLMLSYKPSYVHRLLDCPLILHTKQQYIQYTVLSFLKLFPPPIDGNISVYFFR